MKHFQLFGISMLLLLNYPTAYADCRLSDFTPSGSPHIDIRNSNSRSGSRGNVTSHSTSYTFGATTYSMANMSSTSGCGDGGRAQLHQKLFMYANRDALITDIARGDGEYLVSFSQLMGCDSQVQTEFASVMQTNLAQLLPAEPISDDVLLSRIHKLTADHPTTGKQCQYIG
ncbi:MAG: DUF3015 domain-containing protein [Gammaproteobacteria bacterium]|nr:DUF3015 domain-containing protein [Gammaproteobacteria bacterium]